MIALKPSVGFDRFLVTSLTIIYSTIYSGTDQRKHQSSAPLVFVGGIHRWHVNSPHTNGQWGGKRFHLMTSSCCWFWQAPWPIYKDHTGRASFHFVTISWYTPKWPLTTGKENSHVQICLEICFSWKCQDFVGWLWQQIPCTEKMLTHGKPTWASLQYTESEIKWPPFGRRQFEIYFLG